MEKKKGLVIDKVIEDLEKMSSELEKEVNEHLNENYYKEEENPELTSEEKIEKLKKANEAIGAAKMIVYQIHSYLFLDLGYDVNFEDFKDYRYLDDEFNKISRALDKLYIDNNVSINAMVFSKL